MTTTTKKKKHPSPFHLFFLQEQDQATIHKPPPITLGLRCQIPPFNSLKKDGLVPNFFSSPHTWNVQSPSIKQNIVVQIAQEAQGLRPQHNGRNFPGASTIPNIKVIRVLNCFTFLVLLSFTEHFEATMENLQLKNLHYMRSFQEKIQTEPNKGKEKAYSNINHESNNIYQYVTTVKKRHIQISVISKTRYFINM